MHSFRAFHLHHNVVKKIAINLNLDSACTGQISGNFNKSDNFETVIKEVLHHDDMASQILFAKGHLTRIWSLSSILSHNEQFSRRITKASNMCSGDYINPHFHKTRF
ncbi:hypothetical protein QVD17_35362 [Tagetes erecta]|uniref:Uncharacterized protein n=1 Tax=Tagetes erecta TaxID=13708 RepID=A0AAD8K1Z9_TARER|nr:hypothetical protein QVD17_35362 [Tagetes erecta]